MPSSKGEPDNPELREKVKNEVKGMSKGGGPGSWSAWKAGELARRYEAQGGGYLDKGDHKNKSQKGPPEKKQKQDEKKKDESKDEKKEEEKSKDEDDEKKEQKEDKEEKKDEGKTSKSGSGKGKASASAKKK